MHTMDVKTLCLGLLSLEEACGYELKKKFESLLRHFFPAGYGSIYPALADLANRGLVTWREIPQDGKPDRKVYRITPEGRKRFLEVLHKTNPQHKMRSEFLAMLYFAEQIKPERLQAVLEDQLRTTYAAKAHIAQIERAWDQDAPAGARFIAGFGTAVAEAAAKYIEANRWMLTEGREQPDTRAPGTRRAPALEGCL
jgi:DNA-binding PadR family transcriptional regulator